MRIIGGEFRSRRLLTPRDETITRPIPDRVKESLFGLLRGHCEGASVFDAFAGTGALGLEAVSRGAARCVFVERAREAVDLLRGNIEALRVQDRCEIVPGDALGPGALARCPRPLTLAFFDPPYPVVRDALGWRRVRTQVERVIELLVPDGFAILRTPWPFLIDVSEDPAAPPVAGRAGHERRRRGARRGSRGHERDSATGEWEAPEAQEEHPQPESNNARRIAGDLALAGAEGPETHVYHSTAVHLYMRKRPAPGEGG